MINWISEVYKSEPAAFAVAATLILAALVLLPQVFLWLAAVRKIGGIFAAGELRERKHWQKFTAFTVIAVIVGTVAAALYALSATGSLEGWVGSWYWLAGVFAVPVSASSLVAYMTWRNIARENSLTGGLHC